MFTARFLRVVLVSAFAALAVVGLLTRTTTAFNPQPDPPGFGLVHIVLGESIRVNVVCSMHGVGSLPPGPCRGELMFHDAEGNELGAQEVSLRPGQSASLEFDGRGSVGIDPCWIPSLDSRGHSIPSAEVFDTETGRTMLFMNPAVARLSDLEVGRGR
jgi:hypothetical protein